MGIERLIIQGFKSIKDMDLELRPINILIGANGSGKSNLLSFFEFLRALYDQNLRYYVIANGRANKFLFKGTQTSDLITAKLYFSHSLPIDIAHQRTYRFLLKRVNDRLFFVNEYIGNHADENKSSAREVSSSTDESIIKTSQSIHGAKLISDNLSYITKYHFHDTGKNSPIKGYSTPGKDSQYLYEDGRNIAAFLFTLKSKYHQEYNIILKVIQSVAPYLLDFELNPDDIDGQVSLFWKSKYSSSLFDADDFSDGTLRFIALATLFLQPKPPQTIIIDEPELGLHPTALAILAGLIRSVSRHSQIIIATQSTDLISHFQPEDIITVDQISGESVFTRLNSESLALWLEEYTIDDLWKRSIISTGQPNYR